MEHLTKWFDGKKTYTGLATAVVGAAFVALEQKVGLTGLSDYGYALLAGGLGFAAYGRSVVAPPKPKKARRAPKRVKEVDNA